MRASVCLFLFLSSLTASAFQAPEKYDEALELHRSRSVCEELSAVNPLKRVHDWLEKKPPTFFLI